MSAPQKERPVVQPAWLTAEPVADGSGNGTGGSQTSATSEKTDSSKGPTFKPKFVPKVPVKKEPVPVAPAPATSTSSDGAPSATAARTDASKTNERTSKRNGNNPLVINKFNPKNKSVGFKDGPPANSRKWVMPIGAAFFTGTNNLGSSGGSSTHNSTPATTATRTPAALGSPTARIARPNEQINEIAPKVTKSASTASFSSYVSAPAESDSDAEERDGRDEAEEAAAETNEVWPPVDYDPNAPLALPLGPRSQALRNQLAAEPILADPTDQAAIEKEQSSSLFVLQLPTDLSFSNVKEKVPDGEDANRIHIGKMQLLKSGAVRLIALDGKVYEVSSGMASSFVQIVASIDVPEKSPASSEAAAVKAENGGSHSAHSGSSSRGAAPARVGGVSAAVPAVPEGTLHLMGSVTKKLVVTPSYDIGVRRPRSYSTSTAAHKQNLPGELMYALSQQGGGKYPEDEEVVGDV